MASLRRFAGVATLVEFINERADAEPGAVPPKVLSESITLLRTLEETPTLSLGRAALLVPASLQEREE